MHRCSGVRDPGITVVILRSETDRLRGGSRSVFGLANVAKLTVALVIKRDLKAPTVMS